MLFSSPVFIFVFLPLVLFAYLAARRLVGRSTAGAVLLLSSFFFYGYWRPDYLWIFCLSIVGNFGIGLAIQRVPQRFRRPTLFAGLGANLALLAYFKYSGFIAWNVAALVGGKSDWAVELPLGISFFTFQQIAYLIDVYKDKQMGGGILEYALFVNFFPQLIAGPLVHHKELIPQLGQQLAPAARKDRFIRGCTYFTIGLFKKVVLADQAAALANPIFQRIGEGGGITGSEAWLGAIAYTFQIYLDFSAYSEMAIGSGLMFGFQMPRNFYFPYFSLNIVDFWRRWHITLSRFLRDYLYIPLGGNRNGPHKQKVNLMTTMLLGGLWHGAGWNFVAWGGLHGLYLIGNHTFRERVPFRLPRPLAWALTFVAVVVAWVFFRAEGLSDALAYLKQMGSFSITALFAWQYIAFWLCLLWIVLEPHLVRFRDTLSYGCFTGCLGLISLVMLGEEHEFIYFNF